MTLRRRRARNRGKPPLFLRDRRRRRCRRRFFGFFGWFVFSFSSVLLAVDENDTHASATHTSTTTITTTTTTTTTSNTITTNRAKAKLKFPKSTLNRPQPLYSQKIVIGSEELAGHDVKHVVRQRINALINERCPMVVRSTALIIKSSKTPASANGRIPVRSLHSAHDQHDGKTRVEVSEIDDEVGRGSTTTKTANGCANLTARSNGFDRSGRREAAGKREDPRTRKRQRPSISFFLSLPSPSVSVTSPLPCSCVYVVVVGVGLCFVTLPSSFMLRFDYCDLHGLAPVINVYKPTHPDVRCPQWICEVFWPRYFDRSCLSIGIAVTTFREFRIFMSHWEILVSEYDGQIDYKIMIAITIMIAKVHAWIHVKQSSVDLVCRIVDSWRSMMNFLRWSNFHPNEPLLRNHLRYSFN